MTQSLTSIHVKAAVSAEDWAEYACSQERELAAIAEYAYAQIQWVRAVAALAEWFFPVPCYEPTLDEAIDASVAMRLAFSGGLRVCL